MNNKQPQSIGFYLVIDSFIMVDVWMSYGDTSIIDQTTIT